jgi:hypothetical protein
MPGPAPRTRLFGSHERSTCARMLPEKDAPKRKVSVSYDVAWVQAF